MKSLGVLAATTMTGSIACSKPKKLPNIVLIISDDTGWHDVGYHGSKIKTPVLDKLAKENVELDRFYVYPVCSPTRASLLGGRPPSRWGINAPIGGRSKQALPHEQPTLAGLLKTVGYKTALAGKWHLGLRPEVGPRKYGFDSTYGYLHGQIDQYTHHYKNGDRSWHRNDQFIDEEGHATDLITNEAKRVISDWSKGPEPFFLHIAYSVPHYPLQEEKKWVDPYNDIIENKSRRLFAASMTHMDTRIGDVLETIKTSGIEQDTLVIYLSDNGGQKDWYPSTEYNLKHGPNDVLGNNLPLNGWKGDLYEGGIRVPAIVRWPGKLGSAKVDETIIVYDILTTVSKLTGVTFQQDWVYEGIDVWPVLAEQSKLPERVLYWRSNKEYAVRKGNWKLVHVGKKLDEGEELLFDVIADPYEQSNVVGDHPNVVAVLKAEMVKQAAMDLE